MRTFEYDCQAMATNSRRGRLPAAERAAREAAILDAAQEALVELGADGVTMLDVARRAGASKQTLYAWFGDRDGLLGAIIRHNADATADTIANALRADADPVATLTGFARGLLTLLTRPESVVLNRAAMASPTLAEELLASGRHRVGPIVEGYLATLADADVLDIDDPRDAFTVLYGNIVRDTQIRVLLGERPPSGTEIEERATAAVADFMRRYGR